MNNIDEKSLWKTGKEEHKRFMGLKFNTSTNLFSFLLGILFTAIIVFPFACFLFQMIEIYWFTKKSLLFFLVIAWALLMISNGLSNYITIKIVKAKEKDNDKLQSVDDMAVWFYNTLNPGFGVFVFAIMVFFWVTAQ